MRMASVLLISPFWPADKADFHNDNAAGKLRKPLPSFPVIGRWSRLPTWIIDKSHPWRQAFETDWAAAPIDFLSLMRLSATPWGTP
jgi:hypothetical protein